MAEWPSQHPYVVSTSFLSVRPTTEVTGLTDARER